MLTKLLESPESISENENKQCHFPKIPEGNARKNRFR